MLQGVEFFKQMGAAGEGLVEGPNCVSLMTVLMRALELIALFLMVLQVSEDQSFLSISQERR